MIFIDIWLAWLRLWFPAPKPAPVFRVIQGGKLPAAHRASS